jgi:hypothetical protein
MKLHTTEGCEVCVPRIKWEKEKEKLRDKFEELFPKDKEATLGIRPSKSNRSAALVLWAEWELLTRNLLSDFLTDVVPPKQSQFLENDLYAAGYYNCREAIIKRAEAWNVKIK